MRAAVQLNKVEEESESRSSCSERKGQMEVLTWMCVWLARVSLCWTCMRLSYWTDHLVGALPCLPDWDGVLGV